MKITCPVCRSHLKNSGTGTKEIKDSDTSSLNQYPKGTDLLWMAHYRKDPNGGDVDGPHAKLSGTLVEAAKEAQDIAEREGYVLQCLRRRY